MSKNTVNETTEMTVTGGFSEIANLNFLSDAMSGECAGLEFSLDRVKIPSGGMTAFEVNRLCDPDVASCQRFLPRGLQRRLEPARLWLL